MSVKPGKNTIAVSYFQAALNRWVDSSGRQKNELAAILDIAASSLGQYLKGIKVPSLAQMENIALKMGKDLPDILAEGRAILGGDDQSQAQRKVDPPEFSPEQAQAIEAFKTCLRFGGDLADELAERAIAIARKKQAESDFQNPTPKRLSKSA